MEGPANSKDKQKTLTLAFEIILHPQCSCSTIFLFLEYCALHNIYYLNVPPFWRKCRNWWLFGEWRIINLDAPYIELCMIFRILLSFFGKSCNAYRYTSFFSCYMVSGSNVEFGKVIYNLLATKYKLFLEQQEVPPYTNFTKWSICLDKCQ